MAQRCRVSRFSALLVLALAVHAPAQDHGAALRALDGGQPEEVSRTLRALQLEVGNQDRALDRALTAFLADPSATNRQTLRDRLELRSMGEQARPGVEQAREAAKAAVDTAADPDPGISHQSNWLGRVLERLRGLRLPQEDPAMDASSLAGIGPVVLLVVKVLLGLLLAGFLAFAIWKFRWRRGLRRRAAALLEEDEIERTPDGWLERAEGLASEGRYREAVRCLYLACLLRFDEHAVARFERHETNWEHLARIAASSRLPHGLDFRPPTAAFDRVWYGQHVRGREDFDAFRAWYTEIVSALEGQAA